jgi:hypothetical protein
MQKLTGVHVYEKRKDSEWTTLGLAVQVLSILSWKTRYGRIELYTNDAHLEDLRAHGIDKLYDKIDTSTLASTRVDVEKYWAFGKIQIASIIEPPFVILDTDLWLSQDISFDSSKSYQGYHYEKIFHDHPLNHYIDFDQLIPNNLKGRWDKEILPTNTALLYINDKDLVNEWFKCSYEIANQPNQIEVDSSISHSAYITFIEQRLLPMIAHELNKQYSTIVRPIYLSLPIFNNGNEWSPKASEWDDTTRNEFSKIIHIWGLKNQLNDPKIKDLIRSVITKHFDKYLEAAQFSQLLDYWRD